MGTAREAIAGGIVEGEGNSEFWADGLRAGGRAVFFMLTPKSTTGFDRILTSEIKRICVEHRDSGRRAA